MSIGGSAMSDREQYLAGLSREQLLAAALRLDAMLTAEKLLVYELKTYPPAPSRSDDDRYQEFLLEAMKAVYANRLPATLPDDIVRWAGQIANGLYDKFQAKWTKP